MGSPEGTPLTRVLSMMDLAPPCQSQHPLLPVLGQLASYLTPRPVPPGSAPLPARAGPSPTAASSLLILLQEKLQAWGHVCGRMGCESPCTLTWLSVVLAVPWREPSPCHPRTSAPPSPDFH